jgi:uncharacterized protein (DUF2236 family)
VAPSVGLHLLMHPAVGAAVADHSTFFAEPWDRMLRSTRLIMSTVYAGALAAGLGRSIRDLHRSIKGRDETGRAYHALDPAAFYWAHAAIFMGVVQMAELLDQPLADGALHRLYEDAKRWYRAYGVSDRPMPCDWPAFLAYYRRVCQEELRPTLAARQLVDLLQHPSSMALSWLPAPLRPLARSQVVNLSWLCARAALPPVVRQRMGIAWSCGDQRHMRLVAFAARQLWPRLPWRMRYMADARTALGQARVDGHVRLALARTG